MKWWDNIDIIKRIKYKINERKDLKEKTKQYEMKRELLKNQLADVSEKMCLIQNQFSQETDPDLIEIIVWEQKSLEVQYRNILRYAKKLHIKKINQ